MNIHILMVPGFKTLHYIISQYLHNHIAMLLLEILQAIAYYSVQKQVSEHKTKVGLQISVVKTVV
jgi:hypothetical protein